MLGTTLTMLGTTPTLLGTPPTLLGTAPTTLGNTPTMPGTTPTLQMAKLTARLRRHIGEVIANVLKTPLLQNISNFLSDWLALLRDERDTGAIADSRLLPLFDSAVSNVLLFLCNLLTYTHEFSTKLRKHIALGCNFIQEVVLPYVEFTLGLVEKGCGDASLTRTIVYMVKTLGFVTFQINFFRPYFRTKNFTARLLRACPTVDALAVAIRLNVNIDYYDDKLTQDRDAVSQAIRAAYTGLGEKDQGGLARRLNNPTESLYPLDTTACSYKQLQYAFAPPGGVCTAHRRSECASGARAGPWRVAGRRYLAPQVPT